MKVLRVAIPDGAQVSLESILANRRVLRGLRLGPVEARDAGASSAEAGPIAEPAAGETDPHAAGSPGEGSGSTQAEPAPVLRLGQVGWFRSQRFVEILYTPALPGRPDAAGARDVEFFPEVDASLVVEGVDWDAVSEGALDAASDPYFEDSYRKAFVNYEEGKAFRSWAPQRRRGGPTQLETSSARAGSALLSGYSAEATAPLPPAESIFSGATTPIYRVVLKEPGIYRLTQPYLADPNVAPGLVGANPNNFRLMNMGVEVPIRVVTAVNGVFGIGDYIEFYGEGHTKEPRVLLNFDFDDIELTFPDIYQANDFTDENVYFLFAEPGPRARIPDLVGTVNGAFPVVTSFLETIHREYDTRFVPNGVDDPFYQFPFLFDNNAPVMPDPNAANCGYVNPGAHTFTNHYGPGYASSDARYCPACDLSLPDVVSTGSSATVRVRLRGTSNHVIGGVNLNPDHLAIVQVGTTPTQSATFCFDGELVSTVSVNVPQTALLGAGDAVYVAQPGLSTTSTRESLIMDWIEVDYIRSLRLSGNELEADFSNISRTYDIGGFPTGVPANMIVYDISATVGGSSVPSPRRVTIGTISGGGADNHYSFSLAADGTLPGGAPRVLAAAGAGGFRTPVRVETVTGEDLTLTTNEADMIVITAGSNVDSTPGSDFMDYLAHRASDSNLTVKVVTMRDIYDNFSHGIETPEAIRAFLAYAFDFWTGPGGTSPPVSYLILVGDTTADYKNNLQIQDWVNQIPTFMMFSQGPVLDYYSADTYLAAFRGGDQIPDIHLGRINARTVAESEATFRKMLDYDLNPPAGAWRSHALYLADQGKSAAETAEFEQIQDETADTYFPGGAFTSTVLHYEDPAYANGNDPNGFREDYIAAADAGAALTSFIGHGSFQVWGLDNFFFSEQVALLAPNDKPTFLVNENCLAGGFHALSATTLPFTPTIALGESFQTAANKGAIAVFAPAGLSFSLVSYPINASLYGDMFGLHKERRFGHLMTNIKLILPLPSLTDIHAYTLMGDPAQRFILPAPRPPANFAAASGLDAQVQLTWTPGPDSNVRTRIFRALNPAGAYSVIANGVVGTSFNDTDVVNGNRYYYRAVSTDPNGVYEGGITNTNEDCNIQNIPASGPGCVHAKPINPSPPPVPTGLLVSNPGQGDRLTVGWDAPALNDIDYHTINYGTVEGGPYPFTWVTDAPGAASIVTGLDNGITYYMRLTATNTSGLTSAPSPEARGTPALFEGVNPPAFIDDLRVRRSQSQPTSIELLWTAPVEDIYGGVTTPVQFDVYRSTVPLFQPNQTNRIATILDADANGWIDPGAYATPTSYYYLVTVTDANGFSSGAGRQLPKGIDDMELDHVGGNVTLTWTPVSTDVDGGASFIDHYVVYSSTMPLAREIIDPMLPLAGNVTTPAFSTPVPPGDMIYFTVIVVDKFGNRSPF